MKILPIFVLMGLLSGCTGFAEVFNPQHAERLELERRDKAYARYYADTVSDPDLKKLMLSDDIAAVRAGLAMFFDTPQGREIYMRSIIGTYGPLCAGVGLKPGTADFAQCVIYRHETDQNRRQSERDAQSVQDRLDAIQHRMRQLPQ